MNLAAFTRPLLALAGLMGAAGIVLSAAGAHGKSGMGLDWAAAMLLFHAVASFAILAAINQSLLSRRLALAALAALVLGACLFASDIAMRAFAGHSLFPMAAPTGGVIMIGGWLFMSIAALWR